MEVNFNSMATRHEPIGAGLTGAEVGAVNSSRAPQQKSSLKVSVEACDRLSAAEPTANVPDSALSRNDDIGRLVNAAFSLPAPPMPQFTD